MPIQRYVWLLFAAGHLITVVCGASYLLPNRGSGPAAQALRWYTTMSGAGSSYGFFAPDAGTKHRARFFFQDEQGSAWWDVFDQASSQEARLRLTGIVESAFMTGDAEALPEWRKRLVKSWAATMFTRHPWAVSLTVVVEVYEVPTIAKYRAGSQPTWETVYRAIFQRQCPTASRADR